jgi:hypothetical protein
MGDSNAEMGIFLGGWRIERLEASRRGVVRDVQGPQKTPPHLRQCCMRDERGIRKGERATYVFALEQGKWDATVKVVAGGGRGIGLMGTVRRRSGKAERGKHTFQSCLGRSTAKCSLGRSMGTSKRLEEEEDGELWVRAR